MHATYEPSCRRSGLGQLRRLTYASYSELQEQSSEQRAGAMPSTTSRHRMSTEPELAPVEIDDGQLAGQPLAAARLGQKLCGFFRVSGVQKMKKGRVEAFSDGVFAIIITIMVLDLRAPHSTSFTALRGQVPVFLSYVMSFLYVGVYWNNHHHLLQAAERVNGKVLWANLHLLFWLSLAPFTTAWLGENGIAPGPVATYGIMLLCAGIAYFILTKTLIAQHGKESKIARSIGDDRKGLVSLLVYAVALPLAFVLPVVSCAGYVLVLAMWLFPDPRIEKRLDTEA